MVLVLSGGALMEGHGNLLRAVLEDPQVQRANAAFLARAGEAPVPASRRSVCTLMGEEALVDFSRDEWHVGSMDATTCLIAVAACRVTRKAWAAHYNSSLARRDASIALLLPRHLESPDLFLVGSFSEASGESASTLLRVLLLLHAAALPFRVRLACVDAVNTDGASGGPRALHLALRCGPGGASCDRGWGGGGVGAGGRGQEGGGSGMREGARSVERLGAGAAEGGEELWSASPAGFADRGPELPRRFAHDHLADPWVNASGRDSDDVSDDSGGDNGGGGVGGRDLDLGSLRSLVETASGLLRVPGLHCRPPNPNALRHYALQLELPDGPFLHHNSTSPDFEPPNFVGDLRAAFRYIIEVYVAGLRSIPDACFAWDGAGWRQVPSEAGGAAAVDAVDVNSRGEELEAATAVMSAGCGA
ncbi:hypothetical protein GPECTOR_1g534 [Gonium pectorale]|uniref:Uncharacterized protein n=1 Tax=Gonium pectorale TaxID=33097 RepID=A0A150H3G8_GONPE|nr:hypothetical protein GPECTOR_1g534 [Gonium pectorale]|eukprot:KXZ56594.1 hypothetical protein GPECTOR_1g534 [Gonium pectorale]